MKQTEAIISSKKWAKELSSAKPYLFNLAWQLIEANKERNWDILISDDNSGRLPSIFIQNVLLRAGFDIPLRFMSANSSNRAVTTHRAYEAYVENMIGGIKNPSVLVISEAAGSYGTLKYFVQLLKPQCKSVDFGVAASHGRPPAELNCYIGGFGVNLASRNIYDTFEAPELKGVGKVPGSVLSNLKVRAVPGEPYGHPRADSRYKLLSEFCNDKMSELADEYWAKEGRWHLKSKEPVI